MIIEIAFGATAVFCAYLMREVNVANNQMTRQEKIWNEAWANRELEFNAILVNQNVDPEIDPVFDTADGMPGAGEFAHLVGNMIDPATYAGHCYEGAATSGNPGEQEPFSLTGNQEIRV